MHTLLIILLLVKPLLVLAFGVSIIALFLLGTLFAIEEYREAVKRRETVEARELRTFKLIVKPLAKEFRRKEREKAKHRRHKEAAAWETYFNQFRHGFDSNGALIANLSKHPIFVMEGRKDDASKPGA